MCIMKRIQSLPRSLKSMPCLRLTVRVALVVPCMGVCGLVLATLYDESTTPSNEFPAQISPMWSSPFSVFGAHRLLVKRAFVEAYNEEHGATNRLEVDAVRFLLARRKVLPDMASVEAKVCAGDDVFCELKYAPLFGCAVR